MIPDAADAAGVQRSLHFKDENQPSCRFINTWTQRQRSCQASFTVHFTLGRPGSGHHPRNHAIHR